MCSRHYQDTFISEHNEMMACVGAITTDKADVGIIAIDDDSSDSSICFMF